ncbi:hypothetical protein BGZ96_002246 [Linnemannia gamsii]|uniref:EKC/KEOPS complex subunit GON7 n=1 Tax=Linnemannia gamsii TaxID=64522 RepID=A0ABQ7JLA2_9FUNG|nr:hypothetical protein BGZ96_002246 [Linnemannia gamsii]
MSHPHHDVVFCCTPRQYDSNPPSSLQGGVVTYDEPPPVDLPAVRAQLIEIQARLDAMNTGADQDENDINYNDDADPDEEDDAVPDNPAGDEDANVEQDNPAAENG